MRVVCIPPQQSCWWGGAGKEAWGLSLHMGVGADQEMPSLWASCQVLPSGTAVQTSLGSGGESVGMKAQCPKQRTEHTVPKEYLWGGGVWKLSHLCLWEVGGGSGTDGQASFGLRCHMWAEFATQERSGLAGDREGE